MINPIRLCCGRPHDTVACPDGLVWCCLCFDRVEQDELWEDADGVKWDVCKMCKRDEDLVMQRIREGICVCLRFERNGTCEHVEDARGHE